MMVKSVSFGGSATVLILIIVAFFEIVLGNIASENDLLDQDLMDIVFIFTNVLVVIIYVGCYGVPYRLFCNTFIYIMISVGITIVAYFDSDSFIGLFKNWDVYTYHYGAIAEAHGTEYWHSDTYTRLLSLLYTWFGISYRIGVAVNVFVTVLSVFFLWKTLKLIIGNDKISVFISTLFLFLPWKWELSLFPLREAIPTCLLSISLYYFAKWYIYAEYKWIYIAVLSSICAMMFHSGLIFVPLMYMIYSLLYSPFYKRIIITSRTLFDFGLIIIMVGVICYAFGDEIFQKMPTMEFIFDDMAISKYSDYWTENDGGSSYLKWLSYNSIQDVVIQSPLRALYFALAPVPWEWRGTLDMFSFVTSAGIHVYIYCYIVKYKKCVTSVYKPLLVMLLIMFMLEVFIYGVTTFNSGTAMRHRSKFEIILFVSYAICTKCKSEKSLVDKRG